MIGLISRSFPEIILSVGALILMLQSVSKSCSTSKSIGVVLFGTLGLALCTMLYQGAPEEAELLFKGGLLVDAAAYGIGAALLAFSLIALVFIQFSAISEFFFKGEAASLFTMMLLGLLVSVSSHDLITLFVGIETASLALYCLVGYLSANRLSQEAAIKYFTLGSATSGFLVMGFAFIYFATGSLNLSEIHALSSNELSTNTFALGVILTIAAVGFKLALFPFHSWAPDAYEGSPTALVLYMVVAFKALALVLLMRFSLLLPGFDWRVSLQYLAIASMVYGNLLALVQSSTKRMLAYSSIAHSGYLALGLAALHPQDAMGYQSLLFYMLSYAVAVILALGSVALLEKQTQTNLQLDHFKGLAKKNPFLAVCITAALLSFAGIPPTAGFMGKFFIFYQAVSAKLFLALIIGVIASIVSLFYYLRLIVFMFMSEPHPTLTLDKTPPKFPQGLLAIVFAVLIALGTAFPHAIFQATHGMAVSFYQVTPQADLTSSH